ncbi:alpha/beta hydrolase [Roseomonas sp. OT10]|uniref:alpha/beta hydrolase n=1 Tax=Roseomonas cutis TaxID=2897332 RepID=UPI001E3A6628|nr:alpha/beta hydrolase-fold protein [Roseomonas sp. OT10]UFN47869.1 alpha/beta hydrolase [Roseomonas sp. OT10]
MSPHPSRRALLGAASGLALAARARAAGTAPTEAVESFDLGSGEGPAWRITLAPPAGAAPPGGHPSLWLLDGNATFPLALQARSAAGADGVALVGVGHPGGDRPDVARRFHELTPPTVADNFGERRGNPPETGGRGAFLHFLEAVLRPGLDGRLPLDPARRTLFGHSLGALFGLHVLFTRTELFEAYALADPSIWWNRRSILDEQAAFLAGLRLGGGRAARPVRILLSTSGRAGSPESARRMQSPNGGDTAAALAGVAGLRVGFRHMAEEDHGSMRSPAVADALALAAGGAPEAIASR